MQPTVFVNPACAAVANLPLASLDDGQSRAAAEKVLAFHQQVPHYKETPLHAVPQLAEELQLGHVFIKDESNRFGLPSFKILGASWAVVRAVVDELGLDLEEEDSALLLPATTTSTTTGTKGEEAAGGPHDAHIWQHLRASVAGHASGCLMSLVTCTEGNWGRAVARMAKYLSMPAKIYVPSFMPETTRARISAEGAEVIVVHGNYDDSVAAARKEADASENAILVMDIGWDGYEKIPSVGLLVLPPCLALPPKVHFPGVEKSLTMLIATSGWWKATAPCCASPTPKSKWRPQTLQPLTPSCPWDVAPLPKR